MIQGTRIVCDSCTRETMMIVRPGMIEVRNGDHGRRAHPEHASTLLARDALMLLTGTTDGSAIVETVRQMVL